MKYSKLPIAIAIAAAMSTGFAYAGEKSDVDIDKEVNVDIDVEHRGYVQTLGLVLVDSTATAISEVNQASKDNTVNNGFDTTNDATATDNALNGATGNIGLNVAAGDNNVQQNSTSIARIVSPDSVGVSVQAGYDLTEKHDSEGSYSSSYKSAKSHSSDWSVAGFATHTDSNSLDVDITDGIYTHNQDEQSSSTTSIDANVTGDIDHLSGAGSLSSKGLETAGDENSGGAGHQQAVGFISGEHADLQAGQGTTTVTTAGEEGQDPVTVTTSSPSTYSSNDTTNTNSSTDISGNFSSSYSDSEDNAWEISGDANSDSSYSSEHESAKEKSHSSSYEYTEFARLDANLVFGAALDAETFSNQAAYGNNTTNYGVTNTASLNGNVGMDASGNIGMNITAGNSNVQANQLAIATGTDAVSALATASSNQYAGGNTTNNAPDAVIEVSRSRIVLNQDGSAAGTYSGTSDQNGDVFADAWDNDPTDDATEGHPTEDSFLHHIDYDSSTQGAQGADGGTCGSGNGNGGAFCFDEAGTMELSGIKLVGGSITFSRKYLGHANNASVSGNALRGATGNVGANISAGTNNLQGNALAIASVQASGTE